MKLTLKIILALAVLTAVEAAYAEVPDVSKWSCSDFDAIVYGSDHDIQIRSCSGFNGQKFYFIKVSGELVCIHEHRKDAGKIVYYNALKTNEDQWVEIINKEDLQEESPFLSAELTVNGSYIMNITDDSGAVIAKRLVPRLK